MLLFFIMFLLLMLLLKTFSHLSFFLGKEIDSTEKYVKILIAKAWVILNKMDVILKSDLPDNLKRRCFQAAVEEVLMYGSLSWTLTKTVESQLDGTYTRILRAILNNSWRQHPNL